LVCKKVSCRGGKGCKAVLLNCLYYRVDVIVAKRGRREKGKEKKGRKLWKIIPSGRAPPSLEERRRERGRPGEGGGNIEKIIPSLPRERREEKNKRKRKKKRKGRVA